MKGKWAIMLLVLMVWTTFVAVYAVNAQLTSGDMSKINDSTKNVIVVEGATPITAAVSGRTEKDKPIVVANATREKLAELTGGRQYKIPDTEISLLKYRCEPGVCYYWIAATRGGREVATNSPILIYNPPYHILVSETYDEKTNTLTQSVKEDPLGAVLQILSGYVDRQPLGKATVGTQS